jgi:hypothetical protein
MAGNERFGDSIGKWLEEAAPTALPQRVLAATFERTRGTRQETDWRTVLRRFGMPRSVAVLGGATAVLIVAIVAFGLLVNQPGIGGDPSPTPVARPTMGASPSHDRFSLCIDSFRPETGAVLGCSHDGTRLLIQKGRENLFIVHADGSETQVTEQLTGITRFLGSSRPTGATISPDGSRVVFAGLTKPAEEARSCHDGALFAVDADGGSAELLWASQVPQNGIVRYPTFSPDGARIAFADGYCDSDHSVWVMNADGSDAHQIVSSDIDPLGGTHVHGLAWSSAGDRIVLHVDHGMYSFAPDGSDFTPGNVSSQVCWPGRWC